MRRPAAWIVTIAGVIIFLLCAPRVATAPAASPAAPTGGATEGRVDNVPEIQPTWKLAFDSPVRWERVTSGGRLVVATSKGVHGVDVVKGRIAWSHTFAEAPEAGYQEVPGTPLVVIGDGKRKGHIAVLDAGDGRMVFDSRAARFSGVLTHRLLPHSGGLFVIGLKDGGRTTVMAMADVASGRLRWENAAALSGGGALLGAMSAVTHAIANVPVVDQATVEIDAESFLVNTPIGLLMVASRTGKALWTNRDFRGLNDVRVFVPPRNPDRVFIAAEASAVPGSLQVIPGAGTNATSVYAACRLEDGRGLWRQLTRVQGKVNDVILTDRGLVVSPLGRTDGAINLLDADTGEPRWGKGGRGLAVPGGIVDHQPYEDDLVVTTGHLDAASDREPEFFLNLLDPRAGSLQFERPVRVQGRLRQTEVLSRALLYVTTTEIGLVHPRSGKFLLAPIMSDSPMVTARLEDALYAFSPGAGSLYLVDLDRGTARPISDRQVRLKDRELPTELLATDGAVTVVGRQTLVGFDTAGRLLFHTNYPVPRDLRVAVPLERARQSRKAAAPGFVLMAVDLGKDVHGVGRVSRTTGAVEGLVRLRGAGMPMYEVDPAAGRLYQRTAPAEISAFKF
jgi:outer membrane protein assembly factor BamB